MEDNPIFRNEALRRFTQARRQALLNQIAARLTGRDNRVLPFATIRDKLRQQNSTLLEDFPGRTEADLFASLSVHRERLQEGHGDYDSLADLAQLLADNYKEGGVAKAVRQVRQLLGSDALPPLEELV